MPNGKKDSKALLILENGAFFEGIPFGFYKPSASASEQTLGRANTFGEVVFNTAMTGYQEALTDPSYSGQILAMTYPLVGNYAINKENFESKKIQVRGFVVSELCEMPSHFKAFETLDKFLKDYKIPGLYNVDTRALTQIIRTKGVMKGALCAPNVNIKKVAEEINLRPHPDSEDLLPYVSVEKPNVWNKKGSRNVVLVDTGVKYNILRSLERRDCRITVVPASTSFEKIMKYNPEGVIISNGPGDPAKPAYVVETVRKLINETNLPIFGICLGHQILALAAGAKTYKLKFGHRGVNHPVKDLETGTIHITTQNHGYAVEPKSLEGTNFRATKFNLNDGSIEGLTHKKKPIFSVQYHPEGGPGPQDNRKRANHNRAGC